MKALVGTFNQENALVGAFSVIVRTGCGTDGALHSTSSQPPPVKGDGAEVQRADGGGVHVDGVPEVAHRRPEYPPAPVIASYHRYNCITLYNTSYHRYNNTV